MTVRSWSRRARGPIAKRLCAAGRTGWRGLVVRAHGAAVSIGNYSAILENGVVIGTPEHPVRVGQRTVFGHRATIAGAAIGDLCEIGNGAILMPGSRLGSGCILGEGTLVPPDTVIPAGSVLVGRPPHVIRSATDADRRLPRPGPHRLPGADPGEHGAASAARQRADHRRRRGDRPGRDDPRLPRHDTATLKGTDPRAGRGRLGSFRALRVPWSGPAVVPRPPPC